MKRRAFRGVVTAILLTVLIAGALPFRAAASGAFLGDLNGDGRLNTLDYAMLKRHVMQTYQLSPQGMEMADINGDGRIDAVDYALLKLHVMGRYDIHVENHLLLQDKDGGNCERLQGKVCVFLVFVSDSESTRDASAREKAEARLREEMLRMNGLARENAVDLTLYYGEWDLTVDAEVEAFTADTWTAPVAAAMGFGSLHQMQLALERDWAVASAPVVFVVNKAGRAAAYSHHSAEGAEFLTLYSSDLSPFCHELLHLYGAKDLYFPAEVSAAAAAYFPDSIMATGKRVDELTAYTVGWRDTLTDQAKAFLRDTAHLTREDFDRAMQEEQFTGFGTKVYANGDKYVGYLEYGVPAGEGEYFFAAGTVYRGSFENGTFHGQGVMTWTNGDVYEGAFLRGARTGQGVYRWHNGDVYEGGFLEGKLHGQGRYVYASGAERSGVWSYGVYQGA